MNQQILLDLEIPTDLNRLRMPKALQRRLEMLLARQDRGEPLSRIDRAEAEGLVDVAELLTLLRLRIRNQAVG